MDKIDLAYTGYSGCNMDIISNGEIIGKIQAISIKRKADKAPIYTMGKPFPRNIKGSLMFSYEIPIDVEKLKLGFDIRLTSVNKNGDRQEAYIEEILIPFLREPLVYFEGYPYLARNFSWWKPII